MNVNFLKKGALREMKCPYRNFTECIVEQCPACNYVTNETEVIEGNYPIYMPIDKAVKMGMAWTEIKTTHEFVSCKLVENGVRPVIENKQVINNTTKTSVVVNKSLF